MPQTYAAEQIEALKAEIDAQLPGVRHNYPTLEQAGRLMRRLGANSIEEAFREEARARVLRNRWAAVTSRGEAA